MKEKWRFGFFSQAQTSPWLERQKQALLGKPPNSSTADLTAQQTSLGRNQDSALWELEGNLGYQPVSVQFSSVAQSCPTLCDPMNCSTPTVADPTNCSLPVHHQLSEFTQTRVHRVSDAIQLSHPLSSPSPPVPPSIRVLSNESTLRMSCVC